jgi:hypothetical protein
MHHGCVAHANAGGEGSGRWWPTSRNCRWGGRSITPVSWPPTTSSICPATASPQAAGTAPVPGAWGCRAKHPWPGSSACSKAGTPQLASCSAALTAVTACLPSTWSCGRPRASRSSTAWVTRPPAGRCWPPIMLGWPRRCLPGRVHGRPPRSRRCPARVRTGPVGGRLRPPDVQGGRSTAAHSPGGGQPGPGAGRDLYRHRLAADAIYRATYQRELTRTLGVEWTAADIHGNRELKGMPQDLVRSFSKRTGQIDAELDRLVEHGRERTPRLVK